MNILYFEYTNYIAFIQGYLNKDVHFSSVRASGNFPFNKLDKNAYDIRSKGKTSEKTASFSSSVWAHGKSVFERNGKLWPNRSGIRMELFFLIEALTRSHTFPPSLTCIFHPIIVLSLVFKHAYIHSSSFCEISKIGR